MLFTEVKEIDASTFDFAWTARCYGDAELGYLYCELLEMQPQLGPLSSGRSVKLIDLWHGSWKPAVWSDSGRILSRQLQPQELSSV
jgi:hypothetical protein